MTTIIWSASSGGLSGQTHDLSLASLSDGAARQGEKAPIETPIGGKLYSPMMSIEPASALHAQGDSVYYYLAWSNSATAGTDNDGGCSGADAAYSGNSSDLEFSLRNFLQLVGHMRMSDVAAQQIKKFPPIIPRAAYVMPVVFNDLSGSVALGSDNSELGVGLIELPNA